MNFKIPKNRSTWLLSLNFTYSDDISRLAYKKFILKNIVPRLVAFPNVIKQVKNQFIEKNLDTNFFYINPFKFLILNRNLIKEIVIVGPSYLSIFFILFMKLRKIKVISVIHNHLDFRSDSSPLKSVIGKFIAISSIILSDSVIFTAPHIKNKWVKNKLFKIFNLSNKCKSYRRIFAFNDPIINQKKTKTSIFINIYERKIIDIYSWGRSTPYKDLSMLYNIFQNSKNYLKPNLGLNLIHYGTTTSSKPFFLFHEDSISKLSIINKRPSFEELNHIHYDADFIIFPYTDMSQSGPMRFSREFGSNILVPKMDGSINQLGDYKNKFLFNPNKIETLFIYLNHNFNFKSQYP